MKLVRFLSLAGLAGRLVLGSDGPADNRAAVRVTGAATVTTPPARVPKVLRPLEPGETHLLALPGGAVERPAVVVEAAPVKAPAPVPAPVLVPTNWHPGIPAMPPLPDVAPLQPAVVLGIASALPAFLTGPVNTPPREFVPPVWQPSEAIASPLPPAPEVDGPASAPSDAAGALAELTPPASHPEEPGTSGTKPTYPSVLVQESAVFCQRQIGLWTLEQARATLGEPERQRSAFDDDHTENGQIYAFKDPTGRYRELELDFNKTTGALRTVFVYPWNMTWLECRRLWGARVSSTEGKQGRMFYSYLNRRLDVLVDREGKVISLGLY